MSDILSDIYQQIIHDHMNAEMSAKGYAPLYTASPNARIVIVGQAPGRKAQEAMKPWADASGDVLRKWLGVTEGQFYDPNLFAIVPMDFYYPGKGLSGDKPPRKGFAEKWHTKIMAQMPHVQLVILVGAYAQKHYLGKNAAKNLTETVRAYDDYLPDYFPLVHPSPLNFRWHGRNPWFQESVIPELQARVAAIINAIY